MGKGMESILDEIKNNINEKEEKLIKNEENAKVEFEKGLEEIIQPKNSKYISNEENENISANMGRYIKEAVDFAEELREKKVEIEGGSKKEEDIDLSNIDNNEVEVVFDGSPAERVAMQEKASVHSIPVDEPKISEEKQEIIEEKKEPEIEKVEKKEDTTKEEITDMDKKEEKKEMKKEYHVKEIKKADENTLMRLREKRRKASKKVLYPAVLSNCLLEGIPLSSEYILEGLRYTSESESEYSRLSRVLTILCDLIEIKGIGKVDILTMSKLIAYQELNLLFLVIYLAGTEYTTMSIPCINKDCPQAGEVFDLKIKSSDMVVPDNIDKYKKHVDNIQLYKNSKSIIENSDVNVVKVITLSSGSKVKIKIPSIFDYSERTLVNINEETRAFSKLLGLTPFIKEIQIYDEDTDNYYSTDNFEDIFEELKLYTDSSDLQMIDDLVTSMVEDKLTTIKIPKELIVCPHCGKPYINDLPINIQEMVFLIPEMRKKDKN